MLYFSGSLVLSGKCRKFCSQNISSTSSLSNEPFTFWKMAMTAKRRERTSTSMRRWKRSLYCLGLALLHEVSSDESYMRQSEVETYLDEDQNHGEGSEARVRQCPEAFVHRMLESSGQQIWEGFDDEGKLSPFGVTRHEGNRRILEVSGSDSFYQFQESGNNYGIGFGVRKGNKKTTKSSKKKGGPKKGKGGGNPRPPSSSKSQKRPSPKPPNGSPTRAPTPRPPSGCTVSFNLNFLQFSAVPPAIFNDPSNPDEQSLGTRYIYNDSLRDEDTLDELVGSRASGTCTRIQQRVGDIEVGLQLGGGHCQFTYTLFDGNEEITFNVAGDVFDTVGGVLSVTGGSKSVIGAYGEIELIPVNLNPDGTFVVVSGDFFLDPLFYLADASIVVPCA